MQVQVDVKVLVPVLLHQSLFGSVDGRLPLGVGGQVEPVQVVVVGVQPEVASRNAVWVQDRHHFKYVELQENSRLLTAKI